MNNGINVLSLFDGMSCGQIALERASIKYNNYFASEIDKHAIKVTMANYPDTKQIGSVVDVKSSDLPRIDLLIGGSPCQGFSFAGKGLNFEDPRSKLFFEYVRLLNEILEYNPGVKFLLENVKMKKEHQDVISKYLGVEPVFINSSLVSAQNRQRLYWTNISGINLPEDKDIFLKDVLEGGFVDRDKSYCIDANYFKGTSLQNYLEKCRRQIVNLTTREFDISLHDNGNVRPHRKDLRKSGISEVGTIINPSNKCTAIISSHVPFTTEGFRKLTPIECERLQTVPDNYTNHVSNTQRYRMLGNGWTVDVIAHIFKGVLNNPDTSGIKNK